MPRYLLNKKPSLLRVIWGAAVIALLLLLGLIFYYNYLTDRIAAPLFTAQKPEVYRPDQKQGLRLRIPAIKVDAAVTGVGLDGQGDMEDPDTPEVVGWYKNGPRPGQAGSAVVAGHYGWRGGQAAAFDNLRQLKAGDKVIVEDKGVDNTFVVRESRVYDPEAKVPEVFNRQDGQHLNLITCQGRWDNAKQSYSERLVVFTDLVS